MKESEFVTVKEWVGTGDCRGRPLFNSVLRIENKDAEITLVTVFDDFEEIKQEVIKNNEVVFSRLSDDFMNTYLEKKKEHDKCKSIELKELLTEIMLLKDNIKEKELFIDDLVSNINRLNNMVKNRNGLRSR